VWILDTTLPGDASPSRVYIETEQVENPAYAKFVRDRAGDFVAAFGPAPLGLGGNLATLRAPDPRAEEANTLWWALRKKFMRRVLQFAPPQTLDRPTYVGIWAAGVDPRRILEFHADKRMVDNIVGWQEWAENLPLWGTAAKLEKAYFYWNSPDGRGVDYLVQGVMSFIDDVQYADIIGGLAETGFKLAAREAGKVALEAGEKALIKEGAEVVTPHSGPLRAVTRNQMIEYNSQNIGRLDLARDLAGTTRASTDIAKGIRSGEIGVNILGDEMFARAYRLRFGNLEGIEGTAAFAYGEQTYLRKGSQTFLADAVHEGTHALDFTRGFKGSTMQWEYRAWSAEREYLKRLGLPSPYLDGPAIPSRAGYLREIYDRYGP
jgi:hypothetical protein